MSFAWMHWTATLLAQANVENTPTAGVIPTVWELAVQGGVMMIPIGVLSLVALAVIIERLVSLRRSQVIPRSFFTGLDKHVRDGAIDRTEALAYCRANGSPIAQVFATAIKRLGEPIEQLERHVQEAGERAVLKLRKYLRLLLVIFSVAPLMGLLGTIFGMIRAFKTVAGTADALGKTELLATGIYEALITTAGGLLLAIPTMMAYYFFAAKIEQLVSDIDVATVDFIEQHGGAHATLDDRGPKLRAVESEEEDDDREGAALEKTTARA